MRQYLLIALITLVFIGCGARKPVYLYETPIKYSEVFPLIYDENITSVLILPALNKTNSTDADKFSSDFIMPILAEKGYYVFSPTLVDDFLKLNDITSPKMAREIPLAKLREIFNSDAILYTDIHAWETKKKILNSSVHVFIEYQLRSAKTDTLLWSRRVFKISDTNNRLTINHPFALLFSTVISAIISSVNASSDKHKIALSETYEAYFNLPVSKYHYDYPKEKNDIFGTLRISEFSLKFHKKWLKKHPESKFSASVYADKKLPGNERGNGYFFYVDTDKNGNIIEKNGLPILRNGIYKNDKK